MAGPGGVGWGQQLAQGFILVDVGTSEQILNEPRGMSWGHGGDQRCFSARAKLWKTSCPDIRQKGWDTVLRAMTSLGLEGPSGSGDRMALGRCAWSVLSHCLMFSQETLISFTPSSSSLSLRQPVIHQQGPTPGVQTLP